MPGRGRTPYGKPTIVTVNFAQGTPPPRESRKRPLFPWAPAPPWFEPEYRTARVALPAMRPGERLKRPRSKQDQDWRRFVGHGAGSVAEIGIVVGTPADEIDWRGSYPIICAQPPRFHSASRAASTGCTGTARGTLVLTDFSSLSFVL
jgi:hypothetical protein